MIISKPIFNCIISNCEFVQVFYTEINSFCLSRVSVVIFIAHVPIEYVEIHLFIRVNSYH